MRSAPKVTVVHRTSEQEVRSYSVSRRESDTVFLVNERRRAVLAEIDSARFSWFHLKVAFVSGAGFFTDAYDIFAINIVAAMMGYVYGSGKSAISDLIFAFNPTVNGLAGQSLSAMEQLGLKVATPAGIIVGQLLFGWLGDLLGRKRIYGLELMIMIIGTFGQTISAPSNSVNVVGILIVWRVFMGIGVGGDYPLSAVISSEFSSVHIRGRIMTAVFANQGWGQLAATITSCVVVSAYRDSLLNDAPNILNNIDQMWRIIIGLGCVPAVVALYFRLTIPETPRFTMDIERNVQKAARDVDAFLATETYTVSPDAAMRRLETKRASKEDFRSYFSKWKNFKVLFGTAYSWFALDIAVYGLGLNSSIILTAIGFGSPSKDLIGAESIFENLKNVSIGNLILSVAGFVPGYWVAFLFIDRWGRKPIQIMGFSLLFVLLVAMGFAYKTLISTSKGTNVFVFLYCLTNFFENFGPNTTTFIIPGEAFPTRYRSTAHGISAASGKLGAVVAQIGFQWLKDIGGPNAFIDHILQIFGFFMLTGIISTLLIPETNQRSLESLSNERQDNFFKEPANEQTNIPKQLPHASHQADPAGYDSRAVWARASQLPQPKGYDPVVYERIDELAEVGLSLCLRPNGLRVLSLVPGFLDSIVGQPLADDAVRHPLGEDTVLSSTEYLAQLQGAPGFSMIGVRRAQFNRMVVEVAQRHGREDVVVTFANGTTDTASFVIECDGLHSNTRICLFGQEPVDFTGLVQVRGGSID
ncbi:uncharacterized protein FIBRA_05199 [Fibroporia radiculosa]|uniref:Major facilitator superfamily (MFS) profile domain-containing protein n=1 Tax=Fibroporia radiculosa TaxID=599839 RepID=J4H3D4_9APHY|nr:uncharacterized protein FIBRA_05199 [Fibroporia radiculosa]CCM03079.1 predicted protein [Fibroporia radiculosa]